MSQPRQSSVTSAQSRTSEPGATSFTRPVRGEHRWLDAALGLPGQLLTNNETESHTDGMSQKLSTTGVFLVDKNFRIASLKTVGSAGSSGRPR